MEICRSACLRACLHDLVSCGDVSASRVELLDDAVSMHVLPCERELDWKMVEMETDATFRPLKEIRIVYVMFVKY